MLSLPKQYSNQLFFASKLTIFLRLIGLTCLTLSLIILVIIFQPIISLELQYKTQEAKVTTAPKATISAQLLSLKPKDKNFSIIIPKLNINEKVIPNVDPYDIKAYQKELKKGVAHAKVSSFPDNPGNVFIFSHSVSNPLNIEQYNAIFYLLGKLKKEDEFFLVYNQQLYKYKVTDRKIVNPKEIQYLEEKTSSKTATLMTCWPPGTDLKRLLVIGKQE